MSSKVGGIARAPVWGANLYYYYYYYYYYLNNRRGDNNFIIAIKIQLASKLVYMYQFECHAVVGTLVGLFNI